MKYRTHHCNELCIKHVDQSVELAGWIQTIRTLGNITFIDLRDHYGITQLLLQPEVVDRNVVASLGREFVIHIQGKVIERKNKNTAIFTGEIEIEVHKLTVLNVAKTPPFTIIDQTDGGEDIRMQYRYLDLRRGVLQKNMKLRYQIAKLMRSYLDQLHFNEIETPFLIKSTPEGARDFVIPSRMNAEKFYALPQSPQTFKQLLMVAGYDRYFQIVRCFRDEDLRADRQPEFTQLDCEMSFVGQEDILQTFEGLIVHILQNIKGVQINTPVPRMTYDEAMRDYGIDKPDLRFDMKIQNLKVKHQTALALLEKTTFAVFQEAESILGLVVSGGANYTRKQIDELTDWVKRPQIGMKGLAFLRYKEGKATGSFDKFFTEEDLSLMASHSQMKEGDLLLLLAGEEETTRKATGELRLEIARKENMLDPEKFALLWVTDFPLFMYEESSKSWGACHHPFTSPHPDDMDKVYSSTDLSGIKAQAYDMVLNGMEIGGGSIRIHDRKLQERIFSILQLGEEEIQDRFGFLLKAFEYGAPPHGGIAFGFDRICALMAGTTSIRDVIAFPKNNNGQDTMLNAPSSIDEVQMQELHIALRNDNNK